MEHRDEQMQRFEEAGVCFEKGTLIHTKNGYQSIESLKNGDDVFSYDIKQKKAELKKVIKTVSSVVSEIYIIELSNEEICVTGKHPFYVVGKGWEKVEDLKISDNLLSISKHD